MSFREFKEEIYLVLQVKEGICSCFWLRPSNIYQEFCLIQLKPRPIDIYA